MRGSLPVPNNSVKTATTRAHTKKKKKKTANAQILDAV